MSLAGEILVSRFLITIPARWLNQNKVELLLIFNRIDLEVYKELWVYRIVVSLWVSELGLPSIIKVDTMDYWVELSFRMRAFSSHGTYTICDLGLVALF